MDEMKLNSTFMRFVLRKVIKKIVKKKLDCDITVIINGLQITIKDEKAQLHIDADAATSTDDLIKLLNKAGI